ncbi:TonB-dependent receptor domain-containing protein [Caulobacter sp. 17J80-11]|uniref:TonB-dependent receptor domain-containing protein n=1 Tax=Caulobacter sp. 17J80-11 TaxID=2763502 RepID=UPI0016539306|nr:TonB-dependent receptor [Caulobacter sp. 17J80-11]MBC6982185.1 TonB-dependent receptor [Caulobacter sp. 17J80-11]
MKYLRGALSAAAVLACAFPAYAQRAEENPVVGAGDAFGRSIGAERIGLYNDQEVRGFSPIQAGNVRLDGLYYDHQGGTISTRLVQGSTVRVGLTAQGYLFPAPTGVVDYALRGGGPSQTLSVNLIAGPYEGWGSEVDGDLPIGGGLSVNFGLGYRHNEIAPGDVGDTFGRTAGLTWRGERNAQVRVFWSALDISGDNATPVLLPSAAGLPTAEPIHFYGQNWAINEAGLVSLGLLAAVDPAPGWRVRAGLFRSEVDQERNFADLFRNVGRENFGDRVIVANADQQAGSTSGEVRVSRTFDEGPRRHVVHASLRGRSVVSLRGGASVASFGMAEVGVPAALPEPDYQFGPRTRDELDQYSPGLAYDGFWRGLGEANLGVQRTVYSKTVTRPGAAPTTAQEAAWLYNVGAAWRATPRLSVYGSYTEGLEESGVAPDNATNRGEVLAPIRTRQRDVGLRYAIREDLRVVAGVFEVEKPYVALGVSNQFGEIGVVRHRGLELSVAGPLAPGLNLVAGAVLMDPEVTGEAVQAGLVGPDPIGQTDRVLRLNLDYRPGDGPWSVDFGVAHSGERAARVDNRVYIPARTTADVGARYRFRIGEARAALRLSVTNVTDEYGWNVNGGGALFPMFPRRYTAALVTDF